MFQFLLIWHKILFNFMECFLVYDDDFFRFGCWSFIQFIRCPNILLYTFKTAIYDETELSLKKMEIFTFGDIERTRLHQYESIEEPYISIQNQFQYNPGLFPVPSNYSTYYFVFIVYELFLMLILIAIGAYYFYFCWKIFFEAFVLYIYYI